MCESGDPYGGHNLDVYVYANVPLGTPIIFV